MKNYSNSLTNLFTGISDTSIFARNLINSESLCKMMILVLFVVYSTAQAALCT